MHKQHETSWSQDCCKKVWECEGHLQGRPTPKQKSFSRLAAFKVVIQDRPFLALTLCSMMPLLPVLDLYLSALILTPHSAFIMAIAMLQFTTGNDLPDLICLQLMEMRSSKVTCTLTQVQHRQSNALADGHIPSGQKD